GDEPGTVLDHQVDGRIVDISTVLDGAHAGEDSLPDAFGRVRVCRDGYAEPPGFSDRDLQLFRAEGDIAGIIAHGLESTGYQQLDPVRAELDLAADRLANFLRAVGDQAV